MRIQDYLQFGVFILLLISLTPFVGIYLYKVFTGESFLVTRLLGWLERLAYKFSGINPLDSMDWRAYAVALLAFHLAGLMLTLVVQVLQGYLPLNPQNLAGVPWHLALNTAVSFVTNTDWQSYTPEATMSNLTQMTVLGVQNFVSAATGITVLLALTRGIVNRKEKNLGNFWVDLTRASIYVLLPICIVYALFLLTQGVIQTYAADVEVITLEGLKQKIALGPVASQVAIKMLGTNGGGFFNANSAHPFENSTPLSNFVQMLSIFVIPAGLTFMYGKMTSAKRHGWILFATMLIFFVTLTSLSLWSEFQTNPVFNRVALMEGKETRFGVFNSVLFSTVTTSASCGAVNAMHASLTPLSGGVALLNMMLGEVVFGGVGAGLYGMLLFVLLTVFLAGLMVGRTPEYMGKKIEAREMTMVLLAILAPCAVILLESAVSVVNPAALSSLANNGPHGLSEILYAFTSSAANNGSAFAGLNANTQYFNLTTAFAMLIGRFAIIFPLLAVAGSLAEKKYSPPSAGTFSTDSTIFAVLLAAVIVIIGALTFFPALTLGPIVEHFLMRAGRIF